METCSIDGRAEARKRHGKRRQWVAIALLAIAGQGLIAAPATADCVGPLTDGPVLSPGSALSLTCQTSGGGLPALPGGSLINNQPTVPGSYTYGHGYGAPTTTIYTSPGGTQFGFYDDYVFTIDGAGFNSITSTLDLGQLQVSDLQVRLFELAGNTLPTYGTPTGTVLSAWSALISGPGLSGSYAVIPETILGAGTYVLEVRGAITGAAGGSYAGTLNLTPVPLPAAAWLLLSGLGAFGFGVRRRMA